MKYYHDYTHKRQRAQQTREQGTIGRELIFGELLFVYMARRLRYLFGSDREAQTPGKLNDTRKIERSFENLFPLSCSLSTWPVV